MPLHSICAYKDQKANGASVGTLEGSGTITGHHIIPDHCLFYTSGLRGKGDLSAFLAPGVTKYTTEDAPVILVTADNNGGKTREHGNVHAIFDPIESAAGRRNGDNQWTYEEARAAAVKSLEALGCTKATVEKALDDYFVTICGLTMGTLIRAGEHGTMKNRPAPRKSGRVPRERTHSAQGGHKMY